MEPISVTVSSRGYIVLPASLRKALEIRPGSKMLIRQEKDRLVLEAVPSFTAKLAGLTARTIAEKPTDVDAYIDAERSERTA